MGGSVLRDGEYFVDVVLGSAQVFSLLLDTGSSDVGLSAVGCNGCTHKSHSPYDPSISPLASPLGCGWCASHATNGTHSACKDRGGSTRQCTMIISYADDSGFSAALWRERFEFGAGTTALASPRGLLADIGAIDKTTSTVGAMYEANFPNPRQIDGIVGMASPSESNSGAASPFDDLVEAGAVQDVFSICMHDYGGHLYLGIDDVLPADGPGSAGGDTSRSRNVTAATSMTSVLGPASSFEEARIAGAVLDVGWTARLANSGFYAVGLVDITVGGASIGVAPHVYTDGDAIVDSGSQDLNLPISAYRAIKSTFASRCGKYRSECLKGVCNCETGEPLKTTIFGGVRCVLMTQQDIAQFPIIDLHMADGLVLAYPPTNYLKNGSAFCPDSNMYSIGVESGGDDSSGTIMGDTVMMNYVTIHDRVRSRMGFSPVDGTNCPGTTS